MMVSTDDGGVVLVREASTSRPRNTALPAAPERADGPPTQRDVIAAAHRMRLALLRAAGETQDDGRRSALTGALVQHLLGWAGVPRDTPTWGAVGLDAWLRRVGRAAEDRAHVCGGSGAATSDLLVPGKGSPARLGLLVERRIYRR